MSLFLKQNDHYIGGVYFLGNCGEDFTKKIVWYCFVNKKIVVVVGEFFFCDFRKKLASGCKTRLLRREDKNFYCK